MSNLREELDQAIDQFVTGILEALKSASLADVASETESPRAQARTPMAARSTAGRSGRRGGAVSARAMTTPAKTVPGGRRQRASAEEVEEQKELALATARQLPAGFSKGDVMKNSGAEVDLGRALSLLVAEGRLTKKGDRRNTRYWVR